eukprot:3810609-Rhodomonas_salina.4
MAAAVAKKEAYPRRPSGGQRWSASCSTCSGASRAPARSPGAAQVRQHRVTAVSTHHEHRVTDASTPFTGIAKSTASRHRRK